MQLAPREIDHLLLHQVGHLAQKRLARGLRLNHPEAVALIAAQVLELIRDGRGVAELMQIGRTLLGRRQVLPGVAAMIHDVQVEGTFRDGSKLVTVHHPVCRVDGDLGLALHGSFLPVPDLGVFGEEGDESEPGELVPAEGSIELNAGREAIDLEVVNGADRPIQVGSHYHFGETNAFLRFDRASAYGRRLDVPAGTAVRFEPGETRSVRLVPIAGARVVRGGNGLGSGPVDDEHRGAFLAAVAARGFGHSGQEAT